MWGKQRNMVWITCISPQSKEWWNSNKPPGTVTFTVLFSHLHRSFTLWSILFTHVLVISNTSTQRRTEESSFYLTGGRLYIIKGVPIRVHWYCLLGYSFPEYCFLGHYYTLFFFIDLCNIISLPKLLSVTRWSVHLCLLVFPFVIFSLPLSLYLTQSIAHLLYYGIIYYCNVFWEKLNVTFLKKFF